MVSMPTTWTLLWSSSECRLSFTQPTTAAEKRSKTLREQPNEMWLLNFGMNVRGMCYCTRCVEKGLLDKSLNWGTGKRRVLHQLFNPSAMAKPATDGRCPQRPKCFWEVQHKYLEAGC